MTFEVTELRRVTGSYNTMVGNNEGSMVSAMMSHMQFWSDTLKGGDPVGFPCGLIAGTRPEVTKCIRSSRETDLPVLLRD